MFNRAPHPGWLAVLPQRQRIDFAHVLRGADDATGGPGRPRLAWLHSAARSSAAESDSEALTRLRRSHGLQRFRCATGLAPGGYQAVQVVAPKVAPAELRDALRWRVKDVLDFPVDEAVIDTLPIPTDGAPPGRDALAFVVAAKRAAVGARVRAFQRAGLALSVIDVAESAQRNIAALFETPGRGLALLTLGGQGNGGYSGGADGEEHTGRLTFTRDGQLFGVRQFDLRADTLNDPGQRLAAFERIGLELQRSLDGFDRQFSQVPLQRLLIGGHPHAQPLADFLKDNLYLPVEVADLNRVLDCTDAAALADVTAQSAWFSAIGLALRPDVAE